MAVTEQIKSAIYRVYNSTSSIWNRYSFWNKASSCEFDDGETAEAKLGKIKGITTSLAATETGYAADATAVKTLNDSLTPLSVTLNATDWVVSSDSTYYTQTKTITGITANTLFFPPMMIPSGVKTTDDSTREVLSIINNGVVSSSANTITFKVWEKPSNDAIIYLCGKETA